MIKKTLYFGNPAYLSCQNDQLVISVPHAKGFDKMLGNTIPVEDIGIVILDHQQITITQHLISKLSDNNVALINCDEQHFPARMSQQEPLRYRGQAITHRDDTIFTAHGRYPFEERAAISIPPRLTINGSRFCAGRLEPLLVFRW